MKAFDDALVAYGQNGEPLRPEQGYPARLFLPGWEGNTNVKWLRRIELSDRPFMTREDSATRSVTQVRIDGSRGVASLSWWPRRGVAVIDPASPDASLDIELAAAAALIADDGHA